MFFIVGRGRSGTTLLVSMLEQHPEIVIPPEALFIMILFSDFSHLKKASPAAVEQFYKSLWAEKWINRWGLDKEELKQDLLALGNNADFSTLCKTVYGNYAKKNGKKGSRVLIGDKNPQYSLFIDELMSSFPDAKFIHLTRDFRDNILSFQNVRFDLNSTPILAYRWHNYNRNIQKAKQLYPEKFVTVKYEQLIGAPKKALERICDFLQLPFSQNMLEYYKHQKGRLPSFHQNLKKPPQKKNIGKWRSKMSKEDIEIAENICQDLADKYGYTCSRKRFNPWVTANSMLGCFLGFFSIFFERLFFFLPLLIKERIMEYYRKMVHRGKDYSF